jgi:uncharacterized membrane protein YdjX (TVP38/TMEM64 family)
MRPIATKLWPLLLAFAMFLVVSIAVRQYLESLTLFLQDTPDAYGMALYVVLGIATVLIPFASLVPFMSIAVALWGWEATAGLTVCAWVLGSQLLFELARRLGKPFALKFMSKAKLRHIGTLVEGKSLLRQIAMRWIVHGDLVSYAFGIFTNVTRRNFLLITFIGVLPGAFSTSYFGSLPLAYQAAGASVSILLVAAYLLLQTKHPEWLRALRLQAA